MKRDGIAAEIILDSVNPVGCRLVTWKVKVPRFIWSEVMTHRVFSRNAASSRAVPVKKILRQVMWDPATPVYWGQNQKGMQASCQMRGWRRWLAEHLWYGARWPCVAAAWTLDKLGLHKQLANRILEPWMWMVGVISSTEHDNFFSLRYHPDAQPEFQRLARLMSEAYAASVPTLLQPGEWHLPLVTATERSRFRTEDSKKISVGRCAGASYYRADTDGDPRKAMELHDKLRGAKPPHMSPFEHVAMAESGTAPSGNFEGWTQYRKMIPGESGRTRRDNHVSASH